jgi:hypothetical protein
MMRNVGNLWFMEHSIIFALLDAWVQGRTIPPNRWMSYWLWDDNHEVIVH